MRKTPWLSAVALMLALVGSRLTFGAAPMHFERYGLDEGLTQLAVNAVAQDPSGFLWVGTEHGLDRFDGYGFIHLRHDRLDAGSLTNDFIGDLEMDAVGNLWVATDGGGVVRRSAAGMTFSRLPALAAKDLDRVRVLRFDAEGRLWIGSRDAGLAMLDSAHQRLTRFRHETARIDSLGDDSIFALQLGRRGALWIGTEAGLDRLDLSTGKIRRIDLGRGASRVRALLVDAQDTVWAGTSAGLARLDAGTEAVTWPAKDLPAAQINALLEDRSGRLWVGTDSGLALFDRQRGASETYRHDPANPDSLPDDQVMSLHEDRSGLLWVGTKFGGLAKWNPRSWLFGHQLARTGQGFGSANIMAFTLDQAGRLWAGSMGGGITIVDRRSGSVRQLRHDPKHPGAGLSDDRVMSLLTTRDGTVWAGTMSGGLNRIDPQSLSVTVFAHDPSDAQSLGAPGVMSLMEDSRGKVWAGTFGGGLSRFDPASDRFTQYTADSTDAQRLESGRVTALAEDRNLRIWVGTDGGGLHVLDPARGRIERLPHDPRSAGALSSDTVYSILVDRSGTVWVGTRDGGLDRAIGSSLSPAGVRFQSYSIRDGLPDDTIYGIRSDTKGSLWLSTNRGLARFDPETGAVRSFHRSQGLQGEEFNFGAHYASAAGELFFGGANGYNAFDPSRLYFSASPPQVALTSLSRQGHPVSGPLSLNGGDGAVTFEFAALDFTAPRANRFRYLLEGFDSDWSPPQAQRSVTYTNLDGGHYTLRVRAANADGVWNERAFAMPLHVKPVPWRSPRAYAGYAFAAAALVWLAWLAHRRSIVREVRYSQKLEAEVRRRTLELEQVSLSDALTGLGNRRALTSAMPGMLADTRNGCLALLILDLDNLKPINDEHGHEGGDRVLAGVGELLRAAIGPQDRVVRWGGDEFVIVKTQMDLDATAALAERIRHSVAQQRFPLADGGLATTTCSIGFALYPFVSVAPDAQSWEQVLHLADLALYRAKSRRNAWLGWRGRRTAGAMPDLAAVLAAQIDVASEADYVDCRSSAQEPIAEEFIQRRTGSHSG